MNRSFQEDLSKPFSADDDHEKKFVCAVCGYRYLSREIPFASLPDDWICPVCRSEKSVFRLV